MASICDDSEFAILRIERVDNQHAAFGGPEQWSHGSPKEDKGNTSSYSRRWGIKSARTKGTDTFAQRELQKKYL
jgi:hypothetical protein